MTDIPERSIDPPEPWPCRHIKGEGCEGCDSRGTDECPNEEEEAPMSEWIPVEDRLPEETCRVLAYHKGFGVFEAGYDKRNNWGSLRTSITHWMPLPEPPKEAP